MHDFLAAALGGAMIGLAATLLMITHGKIMGVSGIVSRLTPPLAGDWGWRLSFTLGIVTAPLILAGFNSIPAIQVTNNTGLLIAGGLIVGVGTVLGSGCTSGHGVCGLPRLSPRSIVATGVFMAVAMVTVYVTRHVMGG